MKTRLDIHNEVVAIMKHRGFDVRFIGDLRCTIKRGELWFSTPFDTCNWMWK